MRRLALAVLMLAACEEEEVIPGRDIETMPDLASISVKPDPIDFGALVVGEEVVITAKLVNDSTEPLELKDVALHPAGEAVRLSMDLHNDIAHGLVVQPGKSYKFELTFIAEEVHAFEGDLELFLPANTRKFADVYGEVVE